MPATSTQGYASNGIFFRVAGEGEPLLLLHGLMVNGEMFDPLVDLLRDDFRMLIPDLRGHGKSGTVAGPCDVAALATDLDAVLAEAGFERCSVLGYSHGGAVAQQLAHTRPARVARMMLGCTYAQNAGTRRERLEGAIFETLLRFIDPGTLGRLAIRPSKTKPGGPVGLTREQALWVRGLMASNGRGAMRSAVRGMLAFDSGPWLAELKVPTLVIAGSDDTAVPRYHYDMLVKGIAGACGRIIDRAEHTLIWTHTGELAQIIRTQWAGDAGRATTA